jgi:hypothetical protein
LGSFVRAAVSATELTGASTVLVCKVDILKHVVLE